MPLPSLADQGQIYIPESYKAHLLHKCPLAKQVINSAEVDTNSAMSSSSPLMSRRRERGSKTIFPSRFFRDGAPTAELDNAISRTHQNAQQYSPAICALSKINSQAAFSGAESPLKPGGKDSGDLPEKSSSDSSPSTHFHGPVRASTLHHSIGTIIVPRESGARPQGPEVMCNVSPVACVTPTRPPVHLSSLHESPTTAARPTPRITLPRLSISETLPRQRASLNLPKGAPPEIGGPSRRPMNRRLLPTPPNNLETKLFSLFQEPCSNDDFLPLPLLDPTRRIVEHSGALKSTVRCVVCGVDGEGCSKCSDIWCSKECRMKFQMAGTDKHVCHLEKLVILPAPSANVSTYRSMRVPTSVAA